MAATSGEPPTSLPPNGPLGDLGREDRAALEQLIESFRSYLLLVAERDLGRDLRAKEGPSDLVQLTLFKAERDLGRFEGRTKAELKAWLLTILQNSLRELRRRYRARSRDIRQEVPLEASFCNDAGMRSDSTSPSGRAIRNECAVLLKEALLRLPEKERAVVTWRKDEHCTFEEIGRRLGCSLVSARKVWLDALVRLQEELAVLRDESDGRTGPHDLR
jgi:RNA polymerase sigma-70 factor, ECF subfamily